MTDTKPLLAKTLIGLEDVLAKELEVLGALDVSPGKTFVRFHGDRRLLYKANLACRTAIRILQPIEEFQAESQQEFYSRMQRIDWTMLLDPSGSLAIDVAMRDSFSTNSLYVAQLGKDAIVDQLRQSSGSRPSVDLNDPDLRINLYLNRWQVTVSLDSSGDSLHKRGYRMATGEAPLNEVLAAGMLRLSGWDQSAPLVDFMCGSGTLPIEAALWAENRAPGLVRTSFGFTRWKDFDPQLLDEVRQELEQEVSTTSATIVGSDLDADVLQAARENADRAGVSHAIQWRRASFDEVQPPASSGIIVTNPPYDERLRLAHRAAFYRRIGDTLKHRWPGYTAFVLASGDDTPREFGLRSSGKIRLFNGPIECRLLRFEIGPTETTSSNVDGPSAEHKEPSAPAPRVKRSGDFSDFSNRLRRMARHWLKWARRQQFSAVRLYDRDVPDVPVTIDWYAGWLHVEEQDRPHARSPIEHERWLLGVIEATIQALEVSADRVFFKGHAQRAQRWQRGATPQLLEIEEAARRYRLPISEAPWQLPLDLRTLRTMVEKESTGLRVMLLGDRAASAAVAAAVGGARELVAVAAEPLQSTVRASLEASGVWQGKRRLLTLELDEAVDSFADAQFDLVMAAPPLFLRHDQPADYGAAPAEHAAFVNRLLRTVAANGRVYYVSTARRFKLLDSAIEGASIREIGRSTIPNDFRDKRVHRCWLIQRTL